MKVSDYITFLVNGEASTLAVANVGDMSLNPSVAPTDIQLANQQKFISYINLANLALHKKFSLLKKEIELDNPLDGEEFTLPSDFMAPINAYYQSDKEPVTIKDTSTNIISEIDTAVSILIDEPFLAKIKGTDSQSRTPIILRYSASPPLATSAATRLDVPAAYTDALLNYTAYKAHAAISGNIKDENNTYYMRYIANCKEIIEAGLHGNNELETNYKLEDRGFV